jgi:polyisoprenyl-phosphate glycosyltransferase
MNSSALYIVTPVYFDVAAFKQLRSRVLSVLGDDSGRADSVSFVVVDDSGGRDPEMSHFDDIPDVSVIVPPFNLGHQRAIVYGVRKTLTHVHDADVIVTLDSDGEDRPEDLPAILDALAANAASTIVLARRTRRHEPILFKLFYTLYRLLFRILTGKVIKTGNYSAYSAGLGRRILGHPYFNLCYSSSFESLETPITYVPCERGRRYAGESRMGYTRLVMHGLSMLMPFLDRIALRALIVFSLTMLAGVALSLVVLFIRIFSASPVPGWATYTLLLLTAISFVALGNFVVLFAIFAQSRGASLGSLEDQPS